ncbi:MAG: hypothetical protein ACNA7U_01215 [Candidatus Izemoplasmataceae bacterium]
MITCIMKKYVDGRWIEFDVNELYSVGQTITGNNGDQYKILTINRSKVTLEKIVEDADNEDGE